MMSTIGKHSNYIHRQPLQRVTGEAAGRPCALLDGPHPLALTNGGRRQTTVTTD